MISSICTRYSASRLAFVCCDNYRQSVQGTRLPGWPSSVVISSISTRYTATSWPSSVVISSVCTRYTATRLAFVCCDNYCQSVQGTRLPGWSSSLVISSICTRYTTTRMVFVSGDIVNLYKTRPPGWPLSLVISSICTRHDHQDGRSCGSSAIHQCNGPLLRCCLLIIECLGLVLC